MNLTHQEHHENCALQRFAECIQEVEAAFKSAANEVRNDEDSITRLISLRLELTRILVRTSFHDPCMEGLKEINELPRIRGNTPHLGEVGDYPEGAQDVVRVFRPLSR